MLLPTDFKSEDGVLTESNFAYLFVWIFLVHYVLLILSTNRKIPLYSVNSLDMPILAFLLLTYFISLSVSWTFAASRHLRFNWNSASWFCVFELSFLVNLRKGSVKNASKLKVQSKKVQTAEKAYFRRHQEVGEEMKRLLFIMKAEEPVQCYTFLEPKPI